MIYPGSALIGSRSANSGRATRHREVEQRRRLMNNTLFADVDELRPYSRHSYKAQIDPVVPVTS